MDQFKPIHFNAIQVITGNIGDPLSKNTGFGTQAAAQQHKSVSAFLNQAKRMDCGFCWTLRLARMEKEISSLSWSYMMCPKATTSCERKFLGRFPCSTILPEGNNLTNDLP